MSNAILVPGRPDKEQYYDPDLPTNSNDHWFPWLTKQLMQKDILTVALEVPRPWQPRYDLWKKEFERFDITPETILVGHSCGGGFLVRYLSENKDLKVGKVLLVAPWTNPDNNPNSDTADFFDFSIDPEFPARTKGVTVFISSDDQSSVIETVEILRNKVKGIKYKEYQDKGHFTNKTMHTVEFSDLLEECLT